jgi:hypothetical protein
MRGRLVLRVDVFVKGGGYSGKGASY